MKVTSNLDANQSQLNIINSILSGVKLNTYDSLDNFFDGIDEQIACCDCGNTQKSILYMASVIARADSQYWIKYLDGHDEIAVRGWDQYLNVKYWPANYIYLPMWVNASVLGAVSGFSQFQAAFVGQASYLNTLGIAAGEAGTLISALGLASGKLIFSLPQGPIKEC